MRCPLSCLNYLGYHGKGISFWQRYRFIHRLIISSGQGVAIYEFFSSFLNLIFFLHLFSLLLDIFPSVAFTSKSNVFFLMILSVCLIPSASWCTLGRFDQALDWREPFLRDVLSNTHSFLNKFQEHFFPADRARHCRWPSPYKSWLCEA